jgi:hypothetical protein
MRTLAEPLSARAHSDHKEKMRREAEKTEKKEESARVASKHGFLDFLPRQPQVTQAKKTKRSGNIADRRRWVVESLVWKEMHKKSLRRGKRGGERK